MAYLFKPFYRDASMSNKKPKSLIIRNSTADFLIFTNQAGEDGIEVRHEQESTWLT